MKKKTLQPGDPAPDGIALDVDQNEVRLADLWSRGPTFVTFLRHFG